MIAYRQDKYFVHCVNGAIKFIEEKFPVILLKTHHIALWPLSSRFWFEELLGVWQSCTNSPRWEEVWAKLYAHVIAEILMKVPTITCMYIKLNIALNITGLSLRAGGRGFSPGTRSLSPGYFDTERKYWKEKNASNYKIMN